MDRWATLQNAQSTLRSNDSGLAYLAVLLQKAKAEIVSSGYLSDRTQKQVLSAFCFWDFLFAQSCVQASPPLAEGEKVEGGAGKNLSPTSPERDEDAEKRRSMMLALIDSRLSRLQTFVELMQKREGLENDAETRRLSLPPNDAADKLLRYEAHLDRQLYRGMAKLERMQRQRKGDIVLPPLTVNVSKPG